MIPGDVRIVSAKDLFVSQGTLTGESLPVEKFHEADPKPLNSPTELKNICFMGTSVQSGTATAVVVVTAINSIHAELIGTGTTGPAPQQPATTSAQAKMLPAKPVRGVILEFATKMQQSRGREVLLND
jgi:Mg2+-importing ATPase